MEKQWQYLIEEIHVGNAEAAELQLEELGDGGWEAVTSWALPRDQHINPGKPRFYILFKQPK